ncbi:MAG: hypothetical protein ACRBDI_09345 [Alphaproteobacteria bacterium]
MFVSFVQNAQANTAAEILEKGKQCKSWEATGELSLRDSKGCIINCFRYGMSLQSHPEILSELGIKRCNDAYASVKSQTANTTSQKIETMPKPPSTLKDIVADLNAATGYWGDIMANKNINAINKNQSEQCYNTCDQGVNAIKTKANIGMKYARRYWMNCTSCKAKDVEGNELAPVFKKKAEDKSYTMPDIEGMYLQTTRSGFRVRVEGREEWKTYCNEAARVENGGDEFSRTVKPYDRIRISGITYDPNKANKPVSRCMAKSITILGSKLK